jgi:hypothetical protein
MDIKTTSGDVINDDSTTEAATPNPTFNGAKVIVSSTAPTGLNQTTDVGTIWRDEDTTPATLWQWTGYAWIAYIGVKYAAGTGLDAYYASMQAAGLTSVTFYSQAAAPAHANGRLHQDTDDGKLYRSNGSAWTEILDVNFKNYVNEMVGFLTEKEVSFPITMYYQASAPGGATFGSLWFETDNGLLAWWFNDTMWVSYTGDNRQAPETDGFIPPYSPNAFVQPGVGVLFAYWDEVPNRDPITYDIYVSTSTITTFDPALLVASTQSSIATISTLPEGSELEEDTTYFVRIRARDDDGPAINNGSEAAGQILAAVTQAAIDDAVNEVIAEQSLASVTKKALVLRSSGGWHEHTVAAAHGWTVTDIDVGGGGTIPTRAAIQAGYDLLICDAGYGDITAAMKTAAANAYADGLSVFTTGNDTNSVAPLFSGIGTLGADKDVVPTGSHFLSTGWTTHFDGDNNAYLTGIHADAVVFAKSGINNQPLGVALEDPTTGARWVHLQTYAVTHISTLDDRIYMWFSMRPIRRAETRALKTLWGAPQDTTYINGSFLYAKTVTADKLLVSDFTNYCTDPSCTGTGWSFTGGGYIDATFPNRVAVQDGVIVQPNNGAYQETYGDWFDVIPDDQYNVEFDYVRYASADGNFVVRLYWYTEANVYVSYTDIFGTVGGTNGIWFTVNGNATVPWEVAKARLVIVRYNAASVGSWVFDNFKIRRKAGGNLIVDGAITTLKLHATAVNASYLTANNAWIEALRLTSLVGETITGAIVRSSTTATTNGWQGTSSGLKGYKAGVETFSISNTGDVTLTGSAVVITGAQYQTSASGERIVIRNDGAGGVIESYSGLSSETPGRYDPTLYSGTYPSTLIQPGTNPSYPTAPEIRIYSGTSHTATMATITAGVFAVSSASGTSWINCTRPGGSTRIALGPAEVWLGNNTGTTTTAKGPFVAESTGQFNGGTQFNSDITVVGVTYGDNLRPRTGSNIGLGTNGLTGVAGITMTSGTTVNLSLTAGMNVTTAPNARLTGGSGGGNLVFTSHANSSLRYKENLRPLYLDVPIDVVLAVPVHSYDVREDAPFYQEGLGRQAGFVAEELHDAGLTRWVGYDEEGRPDEVDYAKWTILLHMVAQQKDRDDKKRDAKIAELEALVATLMK